MVCKNETTSKLWGCKVIVDEDMPENVIKIINGQQEFYILLDSPLLDTTCDLSMIPKCISLDFSGY